MEKECPICGTLFETSSANRKYCDNCRTHPEQKWKKAEYALQDSINRTYQPRLAKLTCEYCGKEHVIPVKLLYKVKLTAGSQNNWDEKNHYFCCAEHLEYAVRDHAVCEECGQSLKDKPFNILAHHHYCSEECSQKAKSRIAADSGYVYTCQNCGKEYIRFAKSSTFCSRECMSEAVKKGWRSPKSIENEKIKESKKTTIVLKCKVCKRKFKKTYPNIEELTCAVRNQTLPLFCSKDCAVVYSEAEKAHIEAVQKAKHKKTQAEGKKANGNTTSKSVKGTDICATCKVSYKDCERMQSNFRILPEGAHYDANGVLTTCPKFKK